MSKRTIIYFVCIFLLFQTVYSCSAESKHTHVYSGKTQTVEQEPYITTVDQNNHRVYIETYVYPVCDICGEFGSGRPGEVIEYTEDHILNQDGTCKKCGYSIGLYKDMDNTTSSDDLCDASDDTMVFAIAPTNSDYSYYTVTDEEGNTYVVVTLYKGTDESIEIPSEIEGYPVKSIEVTHVLTTYVDYGFDNGTNVLHHITIPEGVTTLSDGAFRFCNNLQSITIPSSISQMGWGILSGCTELTDVHMDGLKEIGDSMFSRCSSLTIDEIPDSVTTIHFEAFCRCTSLQRITIPDSVTSIGIGAFSECSNLEDVVISHGITYLSSEMFEGCISLAKVTIPEEVTSIGEYVFRNCKNLKDVIIPDQVESIGTQAFRNCSELKSVIIPRSVTYIGKNAFDKDTITLYVYHNSEAALWAQSNGYNYIYIDDGDLMTPFPTANPSNTNDDLFWTPKPEDTSNPLGPTPTPYTDDLFWTPKPPDTSNPLNSTPTATIASTTEPMPTVFDEPIAVLTDEPRIDARTTHTHHWVYYANKATTAKTHPDHEITYRCTSCHSLRTTIERGYRDDCCLCTGNHSYHPLSEVADLYLEGQDDVYEICEWCGTVYYHNSLYRQTKLDRYLAILREFGPNENPLEDDEFRTMMINELVDILGESRRFQAEQIIFTVKNAKPIYRDIYLYSFMMYEINPDYTGTSCNHWAVNNTLSIKTLTWNDNDWIYTFFHESGHAADFNSRNNINSMSHRSVTDEAWEAIYRDTESFLREQMLNYTNKKKLTEQEREAIIQAILHPTDSSLNNLRGNAAKYKAKFAEFCSTYIANIASPISLDSLIGQTAKFWGLNLGTDGNQYMISDVIGGVTNNVVSGQRYHSALDDYWYSYNAETGIWERTNAQIKEAWAEFFSAQITGDEVAMTANRLYFGNTYAYFDERVAPAMRDYLRDQIWYN